MAWQIASVEILAIFLLSFIPLRIYFVEVNLRCRIQSAAIRERFHVPKPT